MNITTQSYLFLSCTITLLTTPAGAEVVYSQPSVSDAARVGMGWYSSSEPRPTRNFKHADNFMLAGDASICSVRWWGLSEGVTHTDLGNFESFTIELYSSRTQPNGNIRPLDLIASQTLMLDSLGTTLTGRSAPSGALEYEHEADLTQVWSLDAGVMYWIAISARSIDPGADAWQWQDSDDFDTLSSSFDYAADRWLVLADTDSAFELIAVPAPGGLCLLGMFGLATQRRRRH